VAWKNLVALRERKRLFLVWDWEGREERREGGREGGLGNELEIETLRRKGGREGGREGGKEELTLGGRLLS
jgi:hypothetical protein